MAPIKAKSLFLLRWLLLLPIPALWCVLSNSGSLAIFENKSVDWRFQYRGELDSPVKIVFVDVDSLSLGEIGNMPWSRMYYSRVASALVHEAKVKVVGFDFVFSDVGLAEVADRRRTVYGNAEFGRFLNTQPPVVLAAAYGGWQFLDVNNKVKERAIPIISTERRRPEQIEPPETPSFETSGNPEKRQPYTPPIAVGLIDTIDSGTRRVPAWTPSNTNRTYFHMAV